MLEKSKFVTLLRFFCGYRHVLLWRLRRKHYDTASFLFLHFGETFYVVLSTNISKQKQKIEFWNGSNDKNNTNDVGAFPAVDMALCGCNRVA